MKSTAINISNDNSNLQAILEETRRLSAYVGLDKKQTLRLTLLAEELAGMLRELSGNFDGKFWAQAKDKNVELITSIFVIDTMDNKTKKGFIDISSEKKNAAAKGIMGKIRDVVENMMYPEKATFNTSYMMGELGVDVMMGDKTLGIDDDDDTTELSANPENVLDGVIFKDSSWSLNQYKNKQREGDEPWDEIEKSIIANIADDVTVSVKGKNVEIKISKRF